MKTTIKKAKQDFEPIDINIRIETKDELKDILLMASALSETAALDEYHLEQSGISLQAFAGMQTFIDAETIVSVIRKMIPNATWDILDEIYAETFNKQ